MFAAGWALVFGVLGCSVAAEPTAEELPGEVTRVAKGGKLSAEIPNEAWIDVDGIVWATNTHVMIRKGDPLPKVSASHQGWRVDLDADQFKAVLTVPEETTELTPTGTLEEGDVLVAQFKRASDGELVHLDAAYANILKGRLLQGSKLGQVFAVGDRGQVTAVVMPRQIGE